jgi:eukaryotic-like serine/threonine-protein kinase
MQAERWARIRQLFEASAELADTERDAYLQAQCADDSELRSEVEALLRADARAQAERTELSAASPELLRALNQDTMQRESDALVGLRLGAWRLQRQIGRGGMGAVYLAERDDGEYVQQAAIKLVRPGWDVGELLQRFRAERQILATLNHSNIACLLDGGVSADGKPYLVLEYVDGSEITRYCNQRRLGIEARLRLFLTVCNAVTHAHRRLVVHRDLKPSNILIDNSGQVKLLDFGIAKLIEPDASITASASRRFTPEYAAPEQVRGEAVTTGVDVYALGLLLYDLMTGRRPYGVTASTPAAYEQAILTQEPQRPSRIAIESNDEARSRAAERHLDPAHLSAQLRGDLDAIVLKALRKEPEQRYAAVATFAEDVQSYLDRKPVAARRGNLRYRAIRFLQRHALASGLAAIAIVALVAGLGIALWQAEHARTEASKSRAALEFMTGLFTLADPVAAQGEHITARELLTTGSQRIREQLLDQPAARAELLRAMGDAYRGLGLYGDALPLLEEAARGAHDPSAALLSHAIVLHQLARHDDALKELLKLRETLMQRRSTDIDFISQIDLRIAVIYVSMNKLEEAGAVYARVLKVQRERHGEDHRQTQEIMLRYAAWMVLRGQSHEARPLTAAVVASVHNQKPRDDEFLARALGAHAMVVSNTGTNREAEALRREEYELTLAIYGDAHPYTLSSRSNLATVLYSEQLFDEALALFEAVLRGRRHQLDPDHPLLALAANHVADALNALGRSEEARPYAQEALRIRLAAYGEQHRNTAMSLRTLGKVEFGTGHLDRAEQLLVRSVASMEAALGPKSSALVGALNDLARVRLAQVPPIPSCAAAQRAFDISGAAAQSEVPEAQYQFALLSACQAAAGDAHGVEVLRASLARMTAELGAQNQQTVIVTKLLAQAEQRALRK